MFESKIGDRTVYFSGWILRSWDNLRSVKKIHRWRDIRRNENSVTGVLFFGWQNGVAGFGWSTWGGLTRSGCGEICVLYKRRDAHHAVVSFVVAVLLFLWSFLVSENLRSSNLFLSRLSFSPLKVPLDSGRRRSALLFGVVFIWSSHGCRYFVLIPGDVL